MRVAVCGVLAMLILIITAPEQAKSACVLNGLELAENSWCARISESQQSQLLNPSAAKLTFLFGKRAAFSCAMFKALNIRRVGVQPDAGAWDPEQANEIGRAHKVTFSTAAQSALSAVAIDLNLSCTSSKPVSFFLWSRTNLTVVAGKNTCEPVRVLLVLRLADICDGTINALALEGEALPSQELTDDTIITHRKFEIDSDARRTLFALPQTFRTRQIDLQSYHAKRHAVLHPYDRSSRNRD